MMRVSSVVIATVLISSCAMFDGHRHERADRRADHGFIQSAADAGLAEVQLGKLAQERAANQSVVAFARRMVDDHSRANDELKRLAAKKGITLPSRPDATHEAARDRLAKLSGPAFDRAYMEMMTTDHNQAVEDFRHASRSNPDADVRAFASRTLPTLEEHQTEARRIQKTVALGGSPQAYRQVRP
jgi:putative membrane protein